jgi:inosine-uridine nucleoside N-ribohydrolase
MVLDTDTYNEIDDQFALVHAMLSPERVTVEAIYAAPFHNDRSTGPEDGMERSYEEIVRLLQRLGRPHEGFVFKGARAWMPGSDSPVHSAAAEDLITRAMADREGPLYVVAIAAPTNVACALVAEPRIVSRIVVVWLGGNASYWPTASEFNLKQDMHASRVLFDSGVPLVHVPCLPVTDHLCTTEAEIERFVRGRGAVGDLLAAEYSAYYEDHFAVSKVIWDLGPVAWLLNPDWVETVLTASPILTTEQTWSHDARRHLIREARYVHRDPIFADLFRKLDAASGRQGSG